MRTLIWNDDVSIKSLEAVKAHGVVVLIDSGANEVVRPFNQSWWDQIQQQKIKGADRLHVKLADGSDVKAVMTQYGEVMFPASMSRSMKWIAPVSRMSEELGIRTVFDPEGAYLVFPSKRRVGLKEIGRLYYLTWKDFANIKHALALSHQRDRKIQPESAEHFVNDVRRRDE